MKQYYELYTIENSLDRVERQLKIIAEDDDKPGVYEKTKRRYDHIEESLEKCLMYVQEIKLHYDIMLKHPELGFEHDYSNDPLRSEVYDVIEARLRRLESQALLPDEVEPYPEDSNDISENLSDDDTEWTSEDDYSEYCKSRDLTIDKFDQVLSVVNSLEYDDLVTYPNIVNSIDFKHVKNCAQMIYEWFHVRFVECKDDLSFNLDLYLRTVPKVIRGIIVGYCYWTITSGDYLSFRHQVLGWCRQLNKTRESHWGCPQVVTYNYKQPPSRTFSLEAVVVYETLLRLGYKSLYKSELIQSDEFVNQGVTNPPFSLSPDLIVTSEIANSSRYKSLLMNRSTSEGYRSLINYSDFNIHRNTEDLDEED